MYQCSVGTETKLGSGDFGWSFQKKAQLGSARHAFKKPRLSLPYLAKKARFSSACSIIQKTKLPSKIKNKLISNIFANFLRFDPKDIDKTVFSLVILYHIDN